MKYILLIYQNPATWETFSEEERNRVMAEVGEIMEELTQSGEWIGGEGLADPSNTKTVRVRDGVPAVTDGPFVESKEQLAGYCIVECETPERATEIARSLGDHREVASNLHDIADSWAHVGDYERARAAASEALGIRRALGDPGGIAHALSSLGDIALFEGEFAEARRIYEEVLALILADSPGSTDHAVFLFSLAECRRRQGDYEGAAATLFDAIEMAAGLSLVFCAPDMLDTAAGLTGQSDARRGALLVGAAEALRTASGFDYFDRAEAERIAASLRDSLGESRFKRAVDEGRQLTLDEAMQTALESLD